MFSSAHRSCSALLAQLAEPSGYRRWRCAGWIVVSLLLLTLSGLIATASAAVPNPFALANRAVILEGTEPEDRAGLEIGQAGDINGDGFEDFLVGTSPGLSGSAAVTTTSTAYLVFGSADELQTGIGINLFAGLNGTNGVRFDTPTSRSVVIPRNGVGDVNGDGLADILIGTSDIAAASDLVGSFGEAYLIFGKEDWSFEATVALTDTLLDGNNGVQFRGLIQGSPSATNISGAGDVNNDGYADLLFGAPLGQVSRGGEAGIGQTYLVFGRADWSTSPTIMLDPSFPNGTDGVLLQGTAIGDASGIGTSGAGDINGDGFDDIAIGSPVIRSGIFTGTLGMTGKVSLVFGKADWSNNATITLNSGFLNGENGVQFQGVAPSELLGITVSGVGDTNGDGLDDLLMGAPTDPGDETNTDPSHSYLVFGRADWSSFANVPLAGSFLDGTNGVRFREPEIGRLLGFSMSDVGDVDGDGLDDFQFGAANDPDILQGVSQTYLVFGRQDWSSIAPVTMDATFIDGIQGARLESSVLEDLAGIATSGAGDTNGDGFTDLLVGAPFADGAMADEDGAGRTYLVYGDDFTAATTNLGSASLDQLTGTTGPDVLNGRDGNDTLNGAGGLDVLIGAQGDDTLSIGDTTYRRIDGGTGTDTVSLDGRDITLALVGDSPSEQARRLQDIEALDIRGTGANRLELELQTVLNLSDTSNTLRVVRNPDDVLEIGTGWVLEETRTEQDRHIEVYRQGAATLQVETTRGFVYLPLAIS